MTPISRLSAWHVKSAALWTKRTPLKESPAATYPATTQAAIISPREAVSIYQRIGAAEAPAAAEYLTHLEAEQA
ncbi:hypothetical protein GCM10017744_003820 [Streptomyces antimycoticus]|uniref:Uncharacterized protein n=1 Tax=Streptomyces antimycoticus TaxID=68175 RepID=A0A4D4KQ68_9ACTN|nr:hypothetical protein SANT12839_095820 [Streptomyces antimycoticus]